MSNLKALYRVYRPSNFSELISQDPIIKVLQNSIVNECIGHAYIFSGPRGTGKTSCAKIFAKTINCLNIKNGEACGKCEICTQQNNVDIIEIDAASNNGVDEIREIRNNTKLVPTSSKYKVYIIDEVHMLSSSAFNAILKTLEEPPAHVIFILATTEINKIPLTVLSRCQRFDFKKITNKCLLEQLKKITKKEGKKLDNETFDTIVSLSDGGLRDAINLLEQVINIDEKENKLDVLYSVTGLIPNETIQSLILSIKNNDISNGLSIIDNMYNQGKNFVRIAEKMLIYVRDISIFNITHDYFSDKKSKELEKFSTFDNDKLLECMKIIIEMIKELNYSNNQKVVFEVYYLKMYDVFQTNDTNNKIIIKEEKEPEEMKEVRKAQINKDVNENENIDIRINNTLATADKQMLIDFTKKAEELEDFFADKTLSSIAKKVSEGKIVASGSKGIIISFKNDVNVEYINNNEDLCKKLLKKIFDYKEKMVGVTDKKWIEIKNEYIKDLKKGIKYEVKPEIKKVIKTNKSSIIESEAIDIFGENSVEIK